MDTAVFYSQTDRMKAKAAELSALAAEAAEQKALIAKKLALETERAMAVAK